MIASLPDTVNLIHCVGVLWSEPGDPLFGLRLWFWPGRCRSRHTCKRNGQSRGTSGSSRPGSSARSRSEGLRTTSGRFRWQIYG
jgi:hypothetical protein